MDFRVVVDEEACVSSFAIGFRGRPALRTVPLADISVTNQSPTALLCLGNGQAMKQASVENEEQEVILHFVMATPRKEKMILLLNSITKISFMNKHTRGICESAFFFQKKQTSVSR